MKRPYTKDEIETFLVNNTTEKKLRYLYKEPFDNEISDSTFVNNDEPVLDIKPEIKQYEYITNWLLNKNIKELFIKNNYFIDEKRKDSYKMPKHNELTEEREARLQGKKLSEKVLAQKLYFIIKKLDILGNIIDYETPCYKTKKDKVGEVDLLAYNENKNILSIIELKQEDNPETMLRAILEISTYFKQLNLDWLKKCFKEDGVNENSEVKKVVLIFKNSPLYNQYIEPNSRLKELAQALEVDILTLEDANGEGNIYNVEKVI
jgi:Holliday junction resolvase-like predicted endonuclease